MKFSPQIFNKDFTKFSESDKYDCIIIDAPCSALGTIRKNPEILFKNKGPNFKDLNYLLKILIVRNIKVKTYIFICKIVPISPQSNLLIMN